MSELVPADGAWNTPPKMVAGTVLFEDFFDRERYRLLKTLTIITGNRAEAEDIAQDAFLRVWERWDRVQRMDDPEAYLNRIAINGFRSRLRRAKVAMKGIGEDPPQIDVFAAADARHMVAAALASLTPRQRAALVVTELWGYPPRDAARLLGVSASTVRALTFQGRAALRGTGDLIHD